MLRLSIRQTVKPVPGVILVRDVERVAEMILGECPVSSEDEGRLPIDGDDGCAKKNESNTSSRT